LKKQLAQQKRRREIKTRPNIGLCFFQQKIVQNYIFSQMFHQYFTGRQSVQQQYCCWIKACFFCNRNKNGIKNYSGKNAKSRLLQHKNKKIVLK
jgi:hypothetical protein